MSSLLLMKLIFITWNIAGLPSLINFSGTPTQKADAIFDKLNNYLIEDKLVVVNLQEIFDKKLVKQLSQAVKNNNYYYSYNGKRANRFFGLNSGLMTISNYPIDEYNFKKYRNSHGEDSFANKGILSTKIMGYWFVNTHMQNDNVLIGMKNSAINAHFNQIKQFGNYFNNLRGSVLYGGDFNVNIDKLAKTVSIEHYWSPNGTTVKGYTPDLTFANFKIKNCIIKTEDYPELSDHKMVILEGLL
jgi:hypothetical protein